MRKIFALSLIACLALSGAAFGVTYTPNSSATAPLTWNTITWDDTSARGDTTKQIAAPKYPGDTSNQNVDVTLAATTNKITIPTIPTTGVTIQNLTVTGTTTGSTSDILPSAPLIVKGVLKVTADNLNILDIAAGVAVNVTSLDLTGSSGAHLYLATAGTGTFTLGGITFTPQGPFISSGATGYTAIAPIGAAATTGATSFNIINENGTAGTSGIADSTPITFGKNAKLAAPTTATNSPTFVTSEKQTLQLLGTSPATLPIPAGNPIVLNGGSIADSSKTPVLTGNARLTTAPTATTDTYALSSTAGSKAIAFEAGTTANKTYALDIEDKVTLDGTLTPVKDSASAYDATLTITGGTIANDKHTIKIGAANSAVVLGSAKGASLAANKYEGITINSADLSGTVAIEGTVSADTLTVASTGDVTLSGDVTLKGATVNGKATLNGNVTLLDSITTNATGVAVNIAGVTGGKLDVFTFTNDASVISLDAVTVGAATTAASIASNDKGVLTFTGAQIKDVKEVKAGAKVVLDTGTTLEVDKDNDLNIYGTLTLANSVTGAAAANAGNFKMAKGDNPQVIVSKDAILALNDNVALSITGSTGNNDQGISKLTVYGTLEFDSVNASIKSTATISSYKNLVLADGAKIVVSDDDLATGASSGTAGSGLQLGRPTSATPTDSALAPKGDLTITLKNANDIVYLTDGIEVASGKTLTINGKGMIYVVPGNAFSNTDTRSYYIDVKDGGTLSIGNNVLTSAAASTAGITNWAFPIKLAGTLAPNELPITKTLPLNTIADTAKLDLDAICLAEIKAGDMDKVVYASDIKDVINGFNGTSGACAIAASPTEDDAAILEEKGTRILFQLRDGNEFGLDVKNTSGDAITYYVPVTVTYSATNKAFTLGLASDDIVSTDLQVYSATETPDTPVTPDPGTGTTTAITVDALEPANSTQDATTKIYTVTTTATTVDFNLPATTDGKTLDYTNAACTATITRGNTTTKATGTIAADGKTVSIPVENTNDEFTVKFTFTKVTTGEVATAADATVTTGETKVIVNGGALTPYITANKTATTYSQKNGEAIVISVDKWVYKFDTVKVTAEGYTVTKPDETKVTETKTATYTANAGNLEIGNYTYEPTATYTLDGATTSVTVAKLTKTFTVNDKKDSGGEGGNGGGGGGCSAGVASLALLLAIPMLLKRK